jgi:hypothetical protein
MVKKGDMLVVGTIRTTPLQRFGRNQRRAAAVLPRAGYRPGVIRFRTWEEFASWQTQQGKG